MKRMRLILGDRLAGGALAMLIAFAMMWQGVVTSLAQGAMAATPLAHEVICAPSGNDDARDARPGGQPDHGALACPCAALCRLASFDAPTPSSVGISVAIIDAPATAIAFAPLADQSGPAIIHPTPTARGPPAFSI